MTEQPQLSTQQINKQNQSNAAGVAFKSGIVAALKTSVFSLPATFALYKYWPPFTKSFNVSSRTAVAVTPPLFAFAFVSEQMASSMANPEAYHEYIQKAESENKIAIHHRLANYFYFNPFKTLIYISVPTIGAIFFTRDASHLKISQRIMHTRVIGQFSVLMILASTMMFHDYMDKRGPYTS